jgi:hypothetical protein
MPSGAPPYTSAAMERLGDLLHTEYNPIERTKEQHAAERQRSGKARRPIYRGRSPSPTDGVSGSSRSRSPSVHRERFFEPAPQTSSTAITP